MNIARFEPWTFVDLLHRDLDRLADHRGITRNDHSAVADWVPAVDIVEQKDCFLLRADVPGVAAADIDVSMENGILSVSGQRHAESHDDADGVRRFERVSGRFHRRFSLPDTADAESIEASFTHGVLEVVIPKLPEVQPRRISVRVS